MSQNHAPKSPIWTPERRHACQRALVSCLDRQTEIADVKPLGRQGAINLHWRLSLAPVSGRSEFGQPNSLILRTRATPQDTGLGKQEAAFPQRYLNSVRRQHHWHRLAAENGVRAPKSFGAIDLEYFGETLVLEDLGRAQPRLSDLCHKSKPEQAQLHRAALQQLVALHKSPPNSDQGFAPPPTPAFDMERLSRDVGPNAPRQLEVLMAEAARLEHELENAPAEALGVPLHGDFRAANIWIEARGIEAKAGAILLDFDFAGIGPAILDLSWMSAPCWRSDTANASGLTDTWLLEAYEKLGGACLGQRMLKIGQLYAQLRWLAISLLQCSRAGKSADQLYASEPNQHPGHVLRHAFDLLEAL